jgi:predicted aldo/keto reductase-like oxidoreductase
VIYKILGKTGIRISAVGFGGMQFDTSKSNKKNAELLPYAYEKGINYFDTAPSYCEDKSEDTFGIAMKEMAPYRDKFYVSSKGMPTDIHSADAARKAVEKSLRRINLERLDFYYVWCIRKVEHYEMAMKRGGLYDGLLKCKEQGLIGRIFISTHLCGPDVKKILSKNEFEGVLLGVNILNFLYRWEGVEVAHEAGLGVLAMNPLAGGVIPKHEKELAFLASGGETPTEAALRFCISCPQITVTLNGFTTKEHIDTACKVADNCTAFTDDDIERVKRNISEGMDSLCTGCGYCVGCCPQDIPVPSYMQFYNDKIIRKKTDRQMVDHLRHHYEWGILVDRKANAGDCTQCGQCEEACTQHLNIIERLEQIADWEEKLKT